MDSNKRKLKDLVPEVATCKMLQQLGIENTVFCWVTVSIEKDKYIATETFVIETSKAKEQGDEYTPAPTFTVF